MAATTSDAGTRRDFLYVASGAVGAVGAAVDLVVDGVNGRIVPPRDAAALEAALRLPRPDGNPAAGSIAGFGYDFAEEQFVSAIELVLAREHARR